jgi:hypothetical protein
MMGKGRNLTLKSRRTTRQIGFEIKEKKGHRDGYTVALILSHIGKDMDVLEADTIDWFGVGETGTIAILACPPGIHFGVLHCRHRSAVG